MKRRKLLILLLLTFTTLNIFSQDNNTYEAHILAGNNYYNNYQVKEALNEFIQAVALDTLRIEGHYGLATCMVAICYTQNKYCNEAIIQINKAMSINPKYRNLYYNRGICKASIGDTYGALNDYNTAIELNPNDPDYYINRSSVFLTTGDSINACYDIKTAIRLGSSKATDFLNIYCK